MKLLDPKENPTSFVLAQPSPNIRSIIMGGIGNLSQDWEANHEESDF